MTLKNPGLFWPMKSPSATKPMKAAVAPEFAVEVGRMIATGELSAEGIAVSGSDLSVANFGSGTIGEYSGGSASRFVNRHLPSFRRPTDLVS